MQDQTPTLDDLDATLRYAINATAQRAATGTGPREADEYANATRTLTEALAELTRTRNGGPW